MAGKMLTQAKVIQRHALLMRGFMLQGSAPGEIWKGVNPTLAQMRALIAVSLLSPCPLSTLANYLAISRPAASEMVGRLEEMGLLNRVVDATNRRQISISLTPTAQDLMTRHDAWMVNRIEDLLIRLDKEVVANWVEVAGEVEKILNPGHELAPKARNRQKHGT
jgi:DNA-binding MarR family transcriptional regulator